MSKLHTEDQVIDILAAAVDKAGAIAQFADLHGICDESVRLIIKRRRPPTGKVLEICGFRKVVRYELIK